MNTIGLFLNDNNGTGPSMYTFNAFLETNEARFLEITNYAFDEITNGERSLILKFNTPVPGNMARLNQNIKLVNKFYPSQIESIYFVNQEESQFAGLGLVPDQSFNFNDVSEIDTYKNYNELTSSIGSNVIDELQRIKKDKNLNVDYSLFENHTFFGSAESKLKNFKTKMVELEGLFSRLNTSLSVSSSQNTIDRRKDLFRQIKTIQDNFTSYEYLSLIHI